HGQPGHLCLRQVNALRLGDLGGVAGKKAVTPATAAVAVDDEASQLRPTASLVACFFKQLPLGCRERVLPIVDVARGERPNDRFGTMSVKAPGYELASRSYCRDHNKIAHPDGVEVA